MNKAKPTPDNPMPLPPYVRPLNPLGAAAMQLHSRSRGRRHQYLDVVMGEGEPPRWRRIAGWVIAAAAVAFVLWSGM